MSWLLEGLKYIPIFMVGAFALAIAGSHSNDVNNDVNSTSSVRPLWAIRFRCNQWPRNG